jgi:hypothetical protein
MMKIKKLLYKFKIKHKLAENKRKALVDRRAEIDHRYGPRYAKDRRKP